MGVDIFGRELNPVGYRADQRVAAFVGVPDGMFVPGGIAAHQRNRKPGTDAGGPRSRRG